MWMNVCVCMYVCVCVCACVSVRARRACFDKMLILKMHYFLPLYNSFYQAVIEDFFVPFQKFNPSTIFLFFFLCWYHWAYWY